MIRRPAALVIGFGLTLIAGKAANIVSGLGLKPTASSVGVLQLLPERATACDGGFSLSSSPASATVDAGCYPASRESGLAEFSAGKPAGVLDSAAQRVTGTACGECEAVALIGGAQSTETTLPVPARAGAGDSGSPASEAVGLLSVGGLAEPENPSWIPEHRPAPDRLLSAIEFVESRHNPRAVGDGGRAVGVLQIHKILVDDCARLAPSEHFTYADRLDPERSRAMFRVYQQHYNPTGDPERGARIWCAGPDGWKQAASLPYWHKVKRAMEEQR